jgi:hypothetical protein
MGVRISDSRSDSGKLDCHETASARHSTRRKGGEPLGSEEQTDRFLLGIIVAADLGHPGGVSPLLDLGSGAVAAGALGPRGGDAQEDPDETGEKELAHDDATPGEVTDLKLIRSRSSPGSHSI